VSDNWVVTTTELPRPLPGAFLIRAIAPGDEAALAAFYGALSPDSREARFHGAASVRDKAAHSFCAAEHERRHGVVAEALDHDGRWVIVGHLCLEPLGDGTAELAIAVADAWQHHGVGRALLREAFAWARRHDVGALLASVRWSNGPMLRLLRDTGRPVTYGTEDAGVVDVAVAIAEPLPHVA
jgi:GNAT superfamily N-acetyltransferase